MRLKAEKACNFNAIVWVLGEVNGYTHSAMVVLRKDFIGFTRLPWMFRHGNRVKHMLSQLRTIV